MINYRLAMYLKRAFKERPYETDELPITRRGELRSPVLPVVALNYRLAPKPSLMEGKVAERSEVR